MAGTETITEKFTWEGSRVFVKKHTETTWNKETHLLSNVDTASHNDNGTTIINGNDLDSTDRITEKLPGHTDPGSISITVNRTKKNIAKIEELEGIRYSSTSSGTLVDVAMIFPAGLNESNAQEYWSVQFDGAFVTQVDTFNNVGSDSIQKAVINIELRTKPHEVASGDIATLMA